MKRKFPSRLRNLATTHSFSSRHDLALRQYECSLWMSDGSWRSPHRPVCEPPLCCLSRRPMRRRGASSQGFFQDCCARGPLRLFLGETSEDQGLKIGGNGGLGHLRGRGCWCGGLLVEQPGESISLKRRSSGYQKESDCSKRIKVTTNVHVVRILDCLRRHILRGTEYRIPQG